MPFLPPPPPARENRILAALGKLQPPHLWPYLERVNLIQGETIYETNSRIEYVYYPETAVFSMLTTTENGDTAEVGPVGQEGMSGLAVFFGAKESSTLVLVHVPGSAMRLGADTLRQELRTEGSVMGRLLLRYTEMLLAMTGQGVACNKLHSLKQQLARWLLLMHDYVGGEFRLTHDLIAMTLGVRRAGISEAANEFRGAGLITYERGRIQLLDRRGLEAAACECYPIVNGEYKRLYADLPKLVT